MRWKPGARDIKEREALMRKASATFCIDDLGEACCKCGNAATAIVRRKPYCQPCGYELYFKKPYVPLTENEKRRMRIMSKAMHQLKDEGPLKTDGPITHYSLNRLAEMMEEIAAEEPWVS